MTAVTVETICCAELLRRMCARHGWRLVSYGSVELAVIGQGLWEIVEPLAGGAEVASERLIERLLSEGLLR